MSLCQPGRCLLRSSATSLPKRQCLRHPSQQTVSSPFSTTSTRQARKRRPHYASLRQEDLAKIEDEAKQFRPYTSEEWKAMKHHFTPAQIAALKEAEKAVDPRDMTTQGQLRTDPWRLKYVEDFKVIDKFADVQPQTEPTQGVLDYEEMESEEWAEVTADKLLSGGDSRTLGEMIAQVKESPLISQKVKDFAEIYRQFEMSTFAEDAKLVLRTLTARIGRFDPTTEAEADAQGVPTQRWLNSLRKSANGEEGSAALKRLNTSLGLDPTDDLQLLRSTNDAEFRKVINDPHYSSELPAVPRYDDPRVRFESEDDDPSQAGMSRLAAALGWSMQRVKALKVKQLVQHRVVNQTRMGKIDSQYNLYIAGNGEGLLGIGEGKSSEMEDASLQGMLNAIRNMKPIHRYEKRTIFGEVKGKSGAVEVTLSSRPPGFGIRTQHLIWEMCRAAGIHDLSARVTRARNPMNTIKATYEALTKQKLPEDVARARGRKMVDVRKVYYAGSV